MFYQIVKFLIRPFVFLLFPTFRKGGKVRIKGRAIVIANHQSNLDTLILPYASRRKLYFMAKDSLFKNRLMGFFCRRLGGFPVKRGSMSIATMRHVLDLLGGGKVLAMYPEGTRHKEGEEGLLHEVKNGVVLFALKTRSPIVPVFIKRRARLFRFNKIVVGKAFELDGLYGQKIDKDVLAAGAQIISEQFNRLKAGEDKPSKSP